MMDRTGSLTIALRALAYAARSPQQLVALRRDASSMARLVSAWARHEYDAVPWRAIAAAAGALLYFLNPLDAVPDLLPGTGLVDDATVLAAVGAALKFEIDRFVEWERRHTGQRSQSREAGDRVDCAR